MSAYETREPRQDVERLEQACVVELGISAKASDLIESVVICEGYTATEILREANEHDAEIIVIGSHGHSTLGELLIGSTAHKLTQLSKIPVLLVPIDDN